MNFNAILTRSIVAVVFALCSFNIENAIAQGMSDQQSYKVKRAVKGNLDDLSRSNFDSLITISRSQGSVLVWVATNATYDASIDRGSLEFERQQLASVKYSEDILAKLKVDSENAKHVKSGPYFAFDATEKHLKKLLHLSEVKGYWGIIGAGRVSNAD